MKISTEVKGKMSPKLVLLHFMDTLGSPCHKAEGRESSPYPGSLIYPNDEQTVHSLHMCVERNGFAVPVSLLPP